MIEYGGWLWDSNVRRWFRYMKVDGRPYGRLYAVPMPVKRRI